MSKLVIFNVSNNTYSASVGIVKMVLKCKGVKAKKKEMS